MICKQCAKAADKNKPKLHRKCSGCDCQHRTGKQWVERMKWNEIPFDPNADPEIKALEFDLQVEENSRAAEQKREEIRIDRRVN